MEWPVYSNMFKTPITSATLAELPLQKQATASVKSSFSIGTIADQRDNFTPETLSFCWNFDMLILSSSQRDTVLRGA